MKYQTEITGEDISRAVMADRDRPCLYHVAGPCQHPKCLNAHYETIRAALLAAAIEKGE